MSIGENIRTLRENRSMTQEQLAQKLGVSDKTVSTWELGTREPRMGSIEKLAEIFGVRKSDIIGDSVLLEAPFPNDLSNVYFRFAKEAQDSGIDPEDIRMAIDTIRRIRGQ